MSTYNEAASSSLPALVRARLMERALMEYRNTGMVLYSVEIIKRGSIIARTGKTTSTVRPTNNALSMVVTDQRRDSLTPSTVAAIFFSSIIARLIKSSSYNGTRICVRCCIRHVAFKAVGLGTAATLRTGTLCEPTRLTSMRFIADHGI